MASQSLIHTAKRYQTLLNHKISVLPIAIIMPHSACNCRCVMCDIWKGNKNSKQLQEKDIEQLLTALRRLDTRRIVMSGGEAMLNPAFFSFCRLIRKQGIKITLLSTGMTLARHADAVHQWVNDVIVSLDGDEATHNHIRNIRTAYEELGKGVRALKAIDNTYPVAARSVIHRLNFSVWDGIIRSAKDLGLDSVSFLPADVSSEAFNRPETWDQDRQQSVLVGSEQLDELRQKIEAIVQEFAPELASGFIVERPEKLRKIHQYYAAHHGLSSFPDKKCNAPWVSAVVEADGTVRPCFFHDAIGNIHQASLDSIVNSSESIRYRKQLNTATNNTCVKCVCYLNLQPRNSQY